MIPVIAAAGRVLAVGSSRAIVASARVLARGGVALGGITARLATRLSVASRAMFTSTKGRTKPIFRFKAKKALDKLDRFEEIIDEVMQSALLEMTKNTARQTGYAHSKISYDDKTLTLHADYDYASMLNRPRYQKNNVSPMGREQGFGRPTEQYIKKEIVRRVKRELGR